MSDIVDSLSVYWRSALWNDNHAIYENLRLNTIATAVFFFLSLVHGNSSWYDPYWSLAPMANAVFFLSLSGDSLFDLNARKLACLALIFAYGLRLTISWWFRLGKSMFLGDAMTRDVHEDWRYVEVKEKPRLGKRLNDLLWWGFSSPVLIHFYPTLCTWLGCAPLFWALSIPSGQQTACSFGGVDLLACLFLGGGAILEAVADLQMDAFLRETEGQKTRPVCRKGLWGISRHPNYCGEMMVWLGIFLFGWSAAGSTSASMEALALPSVVGFLNVVILFATASIPWMERRQRERRGAEYERYQKEVACIIPWLL